MFERFTRDARAVVVTSIDLCTSLDADEVRPVHLLLALTEDDGGARDVLAAHGLTEDAVSAALGAPPAPPPTPLREDDAAALRSLGIDLDAIREAVDAAVRRRRPRGRGRPARRGRRARQGSVTMPIPTVPADASGWAGTRASAGAPRRCSSSRCARRSASTPERSAASTSPWRCCARTTTPSRMLLATLGVDARALRADLEVRGRRSA